jgi:hypothetical protein
MLRNQCRHLIAQWRAVLEVAVAHGALIPACFQKPNGHAFDINDTVADALLFNGADVEEMCKGVQRGVLAAVIWNDLTREHFRRAELPFCAPSLYVHSTPRYGMLVAENAGMNIWVAVRNMRARKRNLLARQFLFIGQETSVAFVRDETPVPLIRIPPQVLTVGEMLAYVRECLSARYGVGTFEEYAQLLQATADDEFRLCSVRPHWPFSMRCAWISCLVSE